MRWRVLSWPSLTSAMVGVTSLVILGASLLVTCTSSPTNSATRGLSSNGNVTFSNLVVVTTSNTRPQVPEATVHPIHIVNLDDVSKEQEDGDNDAAEELDGDDDTKKTKLTRDDNNADEHDDYEDIETDYVGETTRPLVFGNKGSSIPTAISKKRAITATLREVPKEVSDEYHDGVWPEMLPTAAALSEVKAGSYQLADGTYVVTDSEAVPCILAYFKSKITVYYPVMDDGKTFESVASSPPSSAILSGTCDRKAQTGTLEVTWKLGTFIISFAYDTLLDSWYVPSFEFGFNSGKSIFEGSTTDEEVVVKSEDERRFWTTSHAQSFRCMLLHDIALSDEQSRFSGTVHFDEVRVQAFSNDETFKSPKHCLHRVHRDERVPLIVGCTLAGLTVVTIGIYGLIRYFKIKKVQYDTMH